MIKQEQDIIVNLRMPDRNFPICEMMINPCTIDKRQVTIFKDDRNSCF